MPKHTDHQTIVRAEKQGNERSHAESASSARTGHKPSIDAWRSPDNKMHYSGTPTKGSKITESTDAAGKKHYAVYPND